MRKAQVLDLVERVRGLTGVELPVIVGSQALYGVTEAVPEDVARSVECDFLMLAVDAATLRAVRDEIGLFSPFQQQTGYHADPLGLATVVLPTGWRERLVPLSDEGGATRAYCLEVHDTCVSKLIAGREKDFTFIKGLLDRGLADMGTFMARAEPAGDPRDRLRAPRASKSWRRTSRPRARPTTCDPSGSC